MNHISGEYPTECRPATDWGPAQCGMAKSHFANRVIMYTTTLTEAGEWFGDLERDWIKTILN